LGEHSLYHYYTDLANYWLLYDQIKNKGGLYFGYGWGGQNESFIFHAKATESIIIDPDYHKAKVQMPIFGALSISSESRIQFISKLTGRPVTEEDVERMEEETFRAIIQFLEKKNLKRAILTKFGEML